jgi:hypothetical protein
MTLVPSMLTLTILPGRDADGQNCLTRPAGGTATPGAEDRVPFLR